MNGIAVHRLPRGGWRQVSGMLALGVLLLCHPACNAGIPLSVEAGVGGNPARKELALPELPNDWMLFNRLAPLHDSGWFSWYNPESQGLLKEGKGSYAMKEVKVVKKEVVLEKNTYWSGRMVMIDAQKVQEALVMSYSYEWASQGKPAWDCTVRGGPHEGHVSKAQAERILKEWRVGS